ncbi:DMT family transporter [Lampropedia puyangensis]|uniref:DMT family transporter n=1 Tax=Lampropedia puyangensis TaxID=1330072 RepID=A0A4S8F8D3_9BURK|nr:DMT family transporter [Lampropedia puyangensis]THU02895.1 DMT family transporter [Lampropedia puyangensis]
MHALWMVLGAFLFATMGVCVKYASESFSAAEMVFYRGVIGMAILALLARQQGVSLKTHHPGMHAWRSFIGVLALGAWFYALGLLPLATAMTLNYMSSVWIGVFIVASALLYWRPSVGNSKPPLHVGLLLTVLMGFAGVVMMLQPSFQADQSVPAIVGLLSGMFAALAYMQVVVLARIGEPETRVVFYFAAAGMLAGGVVMLFTETHSLLTPQAWWLLPIGILAALGQLCMTRAYSTAAGPRNTLVVASLQYSGIVFGAIYSVLLFSEALGLWGWIGMALIVASGLAATFLRTRAVKPS